MLPREKSLLKNAKNLRKNMTKEERHLWYDFLNSYEVRFRRQQIIGNYIVDFYCDKVKLVVELDGSQHFEKDGQEYDLTRTEYLNSLGITVIRFSNLEISRNFEGICLEIDKVVKTLTPFSQHKADSSP